MVQLIDIGNRTLLKVLIFFMRNPSQKISYTNLRKNIKIAKATLTKNLGFLLKEEFIIQEIIGLSKIYKLNKENSLVKQLKVTDNLFLLNDIKDISSKNNVEIYLYGSAARGEDAEESDFDLLVIGKASKEEIFQNIKDSAARQIKIVIFTHVEWAKMSKNDPAFYERVEKDKIRLC